MPGLPAGQTTICTTSSLSLLFFPLSLLHNKSDTDKDEAVQNKCSNRANQFRCGQVIKWRTQGKGAAGALYLGDKFITSLFPTLQYFNFLQKKKKGVKLQLLCCSFTSNVKNSWSLIRHRPVAQVCKPGVISSVTGSMNNHVAHYSFLIFYLTTPGANTTHIAL